MSFTSTVGGSNLMADCCKCSRIAHIIPTKFILSSRVMHIRIVQLTVGIILSKKSHFYNGYTLEKEEAHLRKSWDCCKHIKSAFIIFIDLAYLSTLLIIMIHYETCIQCSLERSSTNIHIILRHIHIESRVFS